MNAVKPIHANLLLGAPEKWDEEKDGPCSGLHVYQEGGITHSYWRPTEEQIALIKEGALVQLAVFGNTHPPESLGVVPSGIEAPKSHGKNVH